MLERLIRQSPIYRRLLTSNQQFGKRAARLEEKIQDANAAHEKQKGLLAREIERLKLEIHTMRRAILEEPTSSERLKLFVKRRWNELVDLEGAHAKCEGTILRLKSEVSELRSLKDTSDIWVKERQCILNLLNERGIDAGARLLVAGDSRVPDEFASRLIAFFGQFDELTDELASANGRLREIDQAPIRS